MRIKLKPCPFCGDKAVYESYISCKKRWHMVHCGGQHCVIAPSVSRLNPDEAIEIWNHRFCDGDEGYWEYDGSTYKGSVNYIEREGTWRLVKGANPTAL